LPFLFYFLEIIAHENLFYNPTKVALMVERKKFIQGKNTIWPVFCNFTVKAHNNIP